MGAIKTTELANGNIGLEITYGGLEAPFGGIDSSMPPAYIDPKCQQEILGLMVVENQLVAVAMQSLAITLNLPGSGFTGPKLSGFGSFYTKAGGYQNFVLIIGDRTVGAGFTTANAVLYVWPSSNTATPTAIPLEFQQAINYSPLVQATAIIVAGPPFVTGGTPATVDVALSDGTHSESWSAAASLSPNAWITSIVSQINSGVVATAVVNPDGISATLTAAFLQGNNSNKTLINVYTSTSLPGTYSGTNPFLQSGFQGGMDSVAYPTGLVPFPLSFVSEGEVLCLGGPGTVILQYNSGIFSILSSYVGANVLRKFGGSLVALGITPSPGTVIQSPEMVMAWSAASEFGTWNPTDANGNVTGAGFEQLDDIEDILTGGFVNSSTLIILRSKGASYATLTGNGTEPFSVSHVDLAPEGEGCQGQLLSSQYGPIGFYVGNSNIYEFVQQAQGIGDKIKSLIFNQINTAVVGSQSLLMCSKAVETFLLGNNIPVYAILVPPYVYIFNATNNTWTRMLDTASGVQNEAYMEDWPLVSTFANAQFQKQSQLVLGFGNDFAKAYTFYSLQEQVANALSLNTSTSTVTFPAEEVSFGRDITIDGILVSMAGSPGQSLVFTVQDSITGDVILSAPFTFPIGASYQELASYQVYDSGSQQCAGTAKAPQLSVFVETNAGATVNNFRLAKITMFGSFDPKQRPV